MFGRILSCCCGGRGQQPALDSTLAKLDTTAAKLRETCDMLEKKEGIIRSEIAIGLAKAEEFKQANNKREAIKCLKKTQLYKVQAQQLESFQLRILDQIVKLDVAKDTTETFDALKTAAAAMKLVQKAMNIDAVDRTMDEINEQEINMTQIQEALELPTPIAAAADVERNAP